MKSAILICSSIFLALVALSQGVPMIRTLDERIVNGEDAHVGEIPYQISLQLLDSFHFCGGVILNKNYVVTAAHCALGKAANKIKVIAGTTDLNDPQSVHQVVDIIVHAKFNPGNSYINDIALIKVGIEFQFSETISQVPLPKKNAKIPTASLAVASGWGRFSMGGLNPTILQRTDTLIGDPSYCNEMYTELGMSIYNTHICSYNSKVVSGPCKGDSGGPLTVDGILVGLVSFSNNCASPVYPNVYTRVSEYIDWINSHAV